MAADPGKLWMLDPHTRRVLATTALAALNALFFHELAQAAENLSSAQSERLLNFKQAAAKLGKSLDWLYHHHKRLPFTVQLGGGRPAFPENAIEEYIQKHRIL